MLHIDAMALGMYQTNCYIVSREGSNRCIIIDPGYEAPRIINHLEEKGLELEAIMLTHGHFDHVGAVRDLVATTGCKVYLNPADTSMPPAFTAGPLYYSDSYPENGQLQVAGMDILVLKTPGHTPGSVCLLIEDAIFSGDTLFACSCGRTDLPGGDWSQLAASLHRLRDLAGDFRVFPGHERSSTLETERKMNPFMQ